MTDCLYHSCLKGEGGEGLAMLHTWGRKQSLAQSLAVHAGSHERKPPAYPGLYDVTGGTRKVASPMLCSKSGLFECKTESC